MVWQCRQINLKGKGAKNFKKGPLLLSLLLIILFIIIIIIITIAIVVIIIITKWIVRTKYPVTASDNITGFFRSEFERFEYFCANRLE